MADDDIRIDGIEGITGDTLEELVNNEDDKLLDVLANADWSGVDTGPIQGNNELNMNNEQEFIDPQDGVPFIPIYYEMEILDADEERHIRDELFLERRVLSPGNNEGECMYIPNESLLNRNYQRTNLIESPEPEMNDEHLVVLPNFDSRRKKMQNQKITNKIVRVDKQISDDDKEKARRARDAGYTRTCYKKKKTRWEEAIKANTGMEFNVKQRRDEIFEEGNRLITILNNIHNLDPATEFRQKWKGITDRKEYNVTFQKLKKDAKEAREQFEAAEMAYANKENTPHLNPKTLAATKSKKKRRMETFEAELNNLEVEIEMTKQDQLMELMSEFRDQYNLPNPVGSYEPGDPG